MIRSACLAATMLWAPAAANAAVLYTQGPIANVVWASQNDTTGGNGNFATAYDNFTLASTNTVTGLEFTGQFFNPPQLATITAFTVNFYADNMGQPGGTLVSSFTAGNASQNCTGVVCSYNLGVNFNASAGTTYWLSIVPDMGFPPQWGWQGGTGGNGTSYQDFFGTRLQNASDLAFTLTGGAVPEPSTWGLLILGFGLIGGTMRQTRRKTRTALVTA